MAPAYLEAVAAGSGLFFSSHAAEVAETDYLAETMVVDVITVLLGAITPALGFGLLSFSSSVAAATIMVAANS